MSDFSDCPFALGSLVGLRAFAIDSLGRLSGPTYGGVFKPGENVAECAGGPMAVAMRDINRALSNALLRQQQQASRYYGWARSTEAAPTETEAIEEAEVEEHRVGGKDCHCGYYAYFDGDNDYRDPSRVSAVIEGYGVCTYGDRGFRAEKAKLLALVLPGRRAVPWIVFWALLSIGNLWGLIGGITADSLWSTLVSAAALVLSVGNAGWWTRHHHKRDRRHDLVRRNYPDVPVFRSERAAVKAFPLTPPALPDPSDEDFWTRSAR